MKSEANSWFCGGAEDDISTVVVRNIDAVLDRVAVAKDDFRLSSTKDDTALLVLGKVGSEDKSALGILPIADLENVAVERVLRLAGLRLRRWRFLRMFLLLHILLVPDRSIVSNRLKSALPSSLAPWSAHSRGEREYLRQSSDRKVTRLVLVLDNSELLVVVL